MVYQVNSKVVDTLIIYELSTFIVDTKLLSALKKHYLLLPLWNDIASVLITLSGHIDC